MTDTNNSLMRQRLEPILISGFLFCLLLLMVFIHPLALLPAGMNLERMPGRLLLMSGLVTLGVIMGYFARKGASRDLGLFALLAVVAGILVITLPPGSSGKVFVFSLPVFLAMVPVTLTVLTTKDVALPRSLSITAWVFVATVTVQLGRNLGNADLILPFYAVALIPVTVAVLVSQGKLTQSYLDYAALAVFLFSVGYGLQERSPVGISGNPNWFACTVIGVFPWVLSFFHRRLTNVTIWLRWAILTGCIIIPTGWVLYKCHTRTLYLALGFTGVIVAFFAIKRLWVRGLLIVICATTLIISAIIYFIPIKRALNEDVRAPLWFSCFRLVTETPADALTGVGPRTIQLRLPDMLAESGYHRRFVASEWMEHPHNEWLHVIINLGFPAGFAWLVLLLPLLANPLKLSGMTRLAWFSTLLMLILGLSDKGLYIGPSKVWFPICLGVLWAGRIQPESSVPPDAKGRYNLMFLSAAVLSAVFSLYFGYHQICSSWFDRRGEQLIAYNRPAQSRLAYLNALSHVPNDFDLAYKVAAVSLQKVKPFDPDRVRQDLARAYEMNPNFAHINSFMGRYFIMVGRPDDGIRFFLRDIELFPSSVKSHQWLVHCLLISDPSNLLPDAQRALHKKYYQRVISYADFHNRDELPVSWLNRIDEGEWQEALADLNTFIPTMNAHHSMDPIEPWSQGTSWPEEFIGIHFHPADVAFWKAALFRERFREEIKPQSADPAALVWQVIDRISLSDKDSDWAYPHELWESRRGTPASAYSLLAWLSDSPVLIVSKAGSVDADSALIVAGDANGGVLRVNLSQRMVHFLKPAEVTAILEDKELAFHYPALPHEFLTRHHVLQALSDKVAAYRPHLDFAVIPSIKYAMLRRRYPELPARIPCWLPPADAIRKTLLNHSVDKEK